MLLKRTETPVLWFSRHAPSEDQRKNLALSLHKPVQIIQVDQTIDHPEEVTEAMHLNKATELVVVARDEVFVHLYNFGYKPLVAVGSYAGPAEGFKHSHYERIEMARFDTSSYHPKPNSSESVIWFDAKFPVPGQLSRLCNVEKGNDFSFLHFNPTKMDLKAMQEIIAGNNATIVVAKIRISLIQTLIRANPGITFVDENWRNANWLDKLMRKETVTDHRGVKRVPDGFRKIDNAFWESIPLK